MKKLIGLIIIPALVLSLCACGNKPAAAQKTENGTAAESAVTQAQIEEMIIGTWIVADRSGQPAFTNEKGVFTFVSPTKGYLSASYNADPEHGRPWADALEAEVAITDSKVIVTWPARDGVVIEDELSVSDITDTETSGTMTVKSVKEGKETIKTEETIRLVKLNDDHATDILGIWEGHCTSEGSAFDDGQDHRWEYKNDGSYVYYVKDGDNWVASANELNEYFIAGNLLCTRWVDSGTEYREWWEISINGDTMNWTALRKGEDGKGFTVTFEMNRVTE